MVATVLCRQHQKLSALVMGTATAYFTAYSTYDETNSVREQLIELGIVL